MNEPINESINESIGNDERLSMDNEMLDRVNHMKIEFFQSMNHNIKTPLTVISTCIHNISDMIDFGDIDEAEMKELLNIAQREIMRVVQLLSNNMQNVSLYDSHKGMEMIDIASYLRETVDVYSIMLERKFNTLKIEIPETLPNIQGNRDKLSQVMANLISNANRYTSGGEITISADKKDDNNIIIVVRDSGSGIPADILPHVFKRGMSDRGSGLGLHICKMIIEEEHNGKIYAESSQTGTSIIITLPIINKEE